ncbi:unnamed protein product [Prorocentrum cordatum]|uniref:Uncharacterized protein n=1 Tax=Prorocentrum cordatum TaxID=2364126 RepID=A0ABN9VS31_9DINO|nr:unnamed protein product [Polarella glacialis]
MSTATGTSTSTTNSVTTSSTSTLTSTSMTSTSITSSFTTKLPTGTLTASSFRSRVSAVTTATTSFTEELYCDMVDCSRSDMSEMCPHTCMATTTAIARSTWHTITAPAAVALLTGSFSLALSEPADLVRVFEQGDPTVSAALAFGIAAVLPTATPDMVDIISVTLDGRLLSVAEGAEADAGSAGVRISFEAAMPVAWSPAVSFTAQDFLQASDELERALAVELARGALDFSVLGVSNLEATLEFVADAQTTTLSAAAIDGGGVKLVLSVVLLSVGVTVCCVGTLAWRRWGNCLHKSGDRRLGTSLRDAVPAVGSGPGWATPNSLATESLEDGVHIVPRSPAPGESIASLLYGRVARPGVEGQSCPVPMGARRSPAPPGAPGLEASAWRRSRTWPSTSMPWRGRRPTAETRSP